MDWAECATRDPHGVTSGYAIVQPFWHVLFAALPAVWVPYLDPGPWRWTVDIEVKPDRLGSEGSLHVGSALYYRHYK